MRHFFEIQTENELSGAAHEEILARLEEALDSFREAGQFMLLSNINQAEESKVDIFKKD